MMGFAEISKYLPHRYPFLLVDRVLEVNDESIKGVKNVTINEPFFPGHFPDLPIMPGVLMIEAMAQLSGILAFYANGGVPSDNSIYVLGGVDKARFKRPVGPGDQLVMEARILVDRRGVFKFDCSSKVDEELACSAEIMCVKKAMP